MLKSPFILIIKIFQFKVIQKLRSLIYQYIIDKYEEIFKPLIIISLIYILPTTSSSK